MMGVSGELLSGITWQFPNTRAVDNNSQSKHFLLFTLDTLLAPLRWGGESAATAGFEKPYFHLCTYVVTPDLRLGCRISP
jgi:hypothetical protein